MFAWRGARTASPPGVGGSRALCRGHRVHILALTISCRCDGGQSRHLRPGVPDPRPGLRPQARTCRKRLACAGR